MNDSPKLVLNKETLRILTSATPGAMTQMPPPHSRLDAVATCFSCYATCTC